MPCERAEQSLSRSVLEDTRARALMEIMMAKSLGDICLFACSLQNPSSGHRAAPELPRARRWELEPR
jgi:hypothetical protein